MKKEDLPQDPGALDKFTREVCYVKNESGKYETALSRGWEVKKEALDSAWVDVNERIEEARQAVARGEKSPVYYFMELRLMDVTVLAGYTGFFGFFVTRHMKPSVFKGLSNSKLEKYARAFDITVEELKNFKG
jgi:galactokinase/mevalonate kinase-like predicted kinase